MAGVFPPVGTTLDAPDWGLSNEVDANVEVQSLGDGYEVRESIGLNSVRESLSPVWSNLSPAVALTCFNYLKPKLKKESVSWIHPITLVTMKVIPDALKIEWDQYNNAILSITWRQDFNPG